LKRRKVVGVVDLPKGVHRVIARGREYFYFQPGRGTKAAGDRIRLPSDPTDPAFWVALRSLQTVAVPAALTFGDVIDLYLTHHAFTSLSPGTQDQYQRQLRTARTGFGDLPAESVRPSLIRGVMDGLSNKPGTANNFLGAMRALSDWGVARDHFVAPITTGVKPYEREGGHKPWTDAQIEAAHKHLTGMVRRGVMLALYTGQRGSDVVRLGWTDIDDGGFRLKQQKTGREIWCPILPELAAEMATWERRPGPFLRQEIRGCKPYTRKRLSIHFDEFRQKVPELDGATLHGLRSTAVVRQRRAGLSTAQIQDIIGMSMAMIERYSRFADRKASGQAAVVMLAERRIVKHP
jgi:integrase